MLDMDAQILESYPLAMANVNIVNKPLIIFQLEYLQKYGIHDIIITVEKKFAHKMEKYLKQQYSNQDPKANIELVVFLEEEEPVKVLQMLQQKLVSDFIVMEGNSLLDVPLDEVLDTHLLSGSSLTTLIKEFDMVKGGEGAKLAEVGSEDIFGVSTSPNDLMRISNCE